MVLGYLLLFQVFNISIQFIFSSKLFCPDKLFPTLAIQQWDLKGARPRLETGYSLLKTVFLFFLFSATSTRENTVYSVECLRDYM